MNGGMAWPGTAGDGLDGSAGSQGEAGTAAVVVTAHRPAGLLEKLVAVVRPEFRAGLLVFDPRDPVFGGPACGVQGCQRAQRQKGLCTGHVGRWREQGRPDLDAWTAAAQATFQGRGALQCCEVPGCGFGRRGSGLCAGHWNRWVHAGRPDLAGWLPPMPPTPPTPPLPPVTAPARLSWVETTAAPLCAIGGCRLWAHPGAPFCFGHRKRWARAGRPVPADFVDQMAGEQVLKAEQIDLRALPTQLHLEIAYVLQCRRDDAGVQLLPDHVQAVVAVLAGTGLTSLLDVTEQDWAGVHGAALTKRLGAAAFVRDAYRRVEALAIGRGWDVEYPRDLWRIRQLGLAGGPTATLDFTAITQPWLRELAKRWAHRQLSSGLSVATASNSLRAVTRFARYLARPDSTVSVAADIDRAVLERYLGDLAVEMTGTGKHLGYVQGLAGFLRAIHQNGWQDALPASAQLYPDVDYPRKRELLPRALPATVMAQVESPTNLDRWTDPAHRVITLILIRAGLRISSAVGLPFDCLVTDADSAPYLRYWNTKMKREALVPIDDELHCDILAQQQRVLTRFPDRAPVVLFPRPRANLHGTIATRTQCYRDALEKWLATCDVVDEHGRAVHLTPHQWRHTLGTTLINKDVPQHVIQKLLDHDSAEMTAHYARLSDATVRRHWEAARKVNHRGEQVQVDPAGPLADAAWAKHRLGHATQVLPNGYCGLPLVKTCQHANACLTCPLFITTAEFLPQHRAQHRHTLQIIDTARQNGQARMVEMNQHVADNLQKIITELEEETPTTTTATAGGAQAVDDDAC